MKPSRSTLPWAKVSAEIEASQERVWKVLTQTPVSSICMDSRTVGYQAHSTRITITF